MGGVELSTRTLCERLVADYDVDVTVFTTDAYTVANFHDASLPTIPIDPAEEQNGVKIRRFRVDTRWSVPLKQLQRAAWHLRLPGNDHLRTWYHGPISPTMARAVRVAEADVICAASFPLNHLTYPFRRPEPRPPVVLVGAVHTTNAWGYDRPHLIRLIEKSYATVAHTEHERDWLVAKGAAASRIRVIGHGIELDRFRPEQGRFRSTHGIPNDAFVVAYVGQQGGHKGIDTLIDAFARLCETVANAWLAIAGARTPYSPELRARAAALPDAVRARIVFLDDVADGTRAELLSDCDVFASPSTQEAFGITTLEAWSQAKPVVLGDTPSQRSVAEAGTSALLVTPGDAGLLAETLLRLAGDAGLRQSLGEAGRRRLLERYVLSKVVDDYFELFQAAAASRTRAET